MRKFKNKKYRGFDSKLEEARYNELLALQKHGIIKELAKQPKFTLAKRKKILKNGEERFLREITYTADFKYKRDGDVIVEDVKGFKTDVYKIKSKLFIANMDTFGVKEFREVYKDDTIIYRKISDKPEDKIRQLGKIIYGAKYNFSENRAIIEKGNKKILIEYENGKYNVYNMKNKKIAATNKITDKKILLYLNKC